MVNSEPEMILLVLLLSPVTAYCVVPLHLYLPYSVLIYHLPPPIDVSNRASVLEHIRWNRTD